MVPNGWKKTTFGEHIDLLNGFAFKSALYSDDENDIKLLRGDNIEPNKLRWRDVKRWSKNEYESLEKYHLRASDFIIAMDRTWITSGLKVAEVKQEDLPCLLVQRVSRIRSLPTLCQDIIKHHFSSYQFEQYVKGVQTESAVPHISATQIREFGLLLPPLAEQQKIARILSVWDQAIGTTERLVENITQQKKALMQQLLTGKKRLLDESGKRFESEWKETKLGELFKERVETGFNDLPLVSITSTQGVINREDVGRKDTSNSDKSKYRRICPNDIGYNTMRMWQGVSGRSDIEGIVSPAYTILIPIDNVSAKFAAFLFKLPSLVHVFERNSQGLVSDTWNLKYSNFKNIKYKFPVFEEQQKIATVLTNADKEIELLKQQLADLQQEKKALMQVLLTGKRRVTLEELE